VSPSLSSPLAIEDPSLHFYLALMLLNNWDLIVILPFLPIFITFFLLIFVGLAKLDT